MEKMLNEEITERCEPLIGAREVAKLIGVCTRSITNMCRDGRLPHIKVGIRYKFRASAIDAWARKQLEIQPPSVSS